MTTRRGIRRILVAIDASPASLAAADTAVRLASLLETELVGVFVEDRALLELGESPLAHQVSRFGGTATDLASGEIEGQLRAQASRSRSALARLAERERVTWSFRVVRGDVSEEILSVSGETDVVSLGRLGWSLRRGRSLGTTARRLLAQRDRLMLLAERYLEPGRSLVVVHDGSKAGRDAIRLAARLAGKRPERLSILLDQDNEEQVRGETAETLGDEAAKVRLVNLPEVSCEEISRHVERERAGILVMPAAATADEDEKIRTLLCEVDCPVVIVA